jgi:hypothetical protein
VWPKHVAEMYYILNTNTVQPVGSETSAYQTAAWKVNNSKRILTDRPKMDLSLLNYCYRLINVKIDLGSGCKKGKSRPLIFTKIYTFISVKNVFYRSFVLCMGVNNITYFLLYSICLKVLINVKLFFISRICRIC